MAGEEARPPGESEGFLSRLKRKAADVLCEAEQPIPVPGGGSVRAPNVGMAAASVVPPSAATVVSAPAAPQISDSPLYKEISGALSKQNDALAVLGQTWDMLEAVSNPSERMAAALKILKAQGYKPADIVAAIDARTALAKAKVAQVRERGLPARRQEAEALRAQVGGYDQQKEKIRRQIADLEVQIEDLSGKQRSVSADADRMEEQVGAIEADLTNVEERLTRELSAQRAQFLGV